MLRSRFLLAAPLLAVAVTLTACSVGSPAAEPSAGAAAGASSATAAPAGSVSTAGVCGLVPIGTVNSTLGTSYANSKETALPEITLEDAAYCTYTPASGTGQFVIQVATSGPADAVQVFNDATGDVLAAQSGIGDSALYADSVPELVVVWGQTTISVGQDVGATGTMKKVTLAQLEKLADAVHAAA
jgi:hypothetical protein